MSAARTVRMLDRTPGQRPAIEVAGFVIEKDVPLPRGRGKDNPVRIAMAALDVGESFFVPDLKTSVAHGVAKWITTGEKFRVAKESGGARIWRIK